MDSFPFTLINISILFFSLFFIASFPIHFVRSFPSLSDGTTLVSNQERFELGFFSPGSSKNRYVGIWYKKITVKTVVWVANRCKPINDSSGLLTINSTGHLVLLHQNKTTIWSTRLLRPAKKPILELLDSGNLVVRDENDTYLWQSFDHPCDTLLPEMKLGWDFRTGLKRELSAWKNPNDPCPGNLSYGFELNPNTTPEIYIWKGGKKYYRSGPWNGLRFSGVQELMTNPLYDFFYFYNDEELYYMFKFKVDFVIFARVVLNETTTMRERYVWLQNQTWGQFSSAPEEDCDKYGLCGANGNCATSKKIPKCSCLKGFRPVSQEKWDSRDWSSGCVRKKPLSCEEKHSDGFKEFVGLKLPDTTLSWKSPGLNISECKAKCLRNCSCMAYSNLDIRGQGSGCIIWFGDLMDIRQFPSEGQNLFVRFPHSELGGKSAEKRRVAIIVTIVGVVFGLLLVGLYVSRKIFLKAKSDRNQDNKDENEDLDLPLFDLATISSATNEFSAKNKLGEGGFGPVYKGTLGDGQEIAVKRLSKCSGQGLSEFKNEVILIAKLQHRNLVRLLGCCIQGEEKLLIYEYMPNKSLDFFIFDETRKKLLDWSKRFEIICGVARGILYLHQDSRLRIIHRDLKASNVLLDSEMVPKISDFGMAKTFGGDQTEGNTNRVVGTYGYMAPEYASDGMFSVKSDVFSFGILMLEIISGKKNRGFFNPDQRLNLTGYAWKLLKEANSQELIDECLVGSCDLNEALRCIHISLLCVQQCPEDRPSMSSVVLMLASDQNSSSLVQPKHPGFFVPRSFNSINVSSSVQESSSSTNEVTISVLDPR